MRPSAFGEIVITSWHDLPGHHPAVALDAFVLMPNHVHGIIIVQRHIVVGASPASPSPAEPAPPTGPPAHSLGAIVGAFKSAAARRINQTRETPAPPIWQRNYHEQIIRNETVLTAVRRYIHDNPRNWARDNENPTNHPPTPPS